MLNLPWNYGKFDHKVKYIKIFEEILFPFGHPRLVALWTCCSYLMSAHPALALIGYDNNACKFTLKVRSHLVLRTSSVTPY
jgi:hypothetical protein